MATGTELGSGRTRMQTNPGCSLTSGACSPRTGDKPVRAGVGTAVSPEAQSDLGQFRPREAEDLQGLESRTKQALGIEIKNNRLHNGLKHPSLRNRP